MKALNTLPTLILFSALGCATATINPEEEEKTELPGSGGFVGDGDTGSGGVVTGSSGGTASGGTTIGDGDGDLVGDGDGDLIGDGDGDLIGDGDGDLGTGGDSGSGGDAGTGGAVSSSCTGCKAWSEFGYHMPAPPNPGDCVSALNGTDYVFVSGMYNEACGPPGEAEGWCADKDGVFEVCD